MADLKKHFALWNWTNLKQKKPPFPNKERRLYNPKQRCCKIYSISVGVPYARTLNKFLIPARFSDLRLPKEPFPFRISNLRFEISKTVVHFLLAVKRLQRRDRHGFEPCSLFRNQYSIFKRTGVVYCTPIYM